MFFLPRISIFLLISLAFAAQLRAQNGKGITGDSAMVVTAHPLASEIGIRILKKGGNAYDATIAVQFALAVCFPIAGNIGGGGFMVYRTPDGATGSLDFREKAPVKSSRDMFLDPSGAVIPGSSTLGHLSAGVPGSIAGIFELHKKFGSVPIMDLIQPAIELAENGVILTKKEAAELNKYQGEFRKINKENTAFNNLNDWKPGDVLIQPDLARTLKAIRDQGENAFYEGIIADQIVAEMKSANGIISKEDLKNYTPVWRKTLRTSFNGYDLISMAPPSSGGLVLFQILKMIKRMEPDGLKGWNVPETVHVLVEAEKRAYADRSIYLGDPDFRKVPTRELLDTLYIENKIKNYNRKRSSKSSEINPGSIPVIESDQTTHFCIVDKWGNAASVTTTLNNAFGSKLVVKGAGFLLNNQMDDFSIKPGTPNSYGLTGGNANSIKPGKRMLSSMTPTIIEKNGKLFMIIGTPGGSTIITSVLQGFLNVTIHGMSMQEAVDAPRFHHQWLPDLIYYEENAFTGRTKRKLKKLGHELKIKDAYGRMEGILINEDGQLEGGADHRGDDAARGY